MDNKPIGAIKTARKEYKCMGCGGIIKKGSQYDYSDGMSATYHNEYGEPERKYYQFRVHAPGECVEVEPINEISLDSDLFDF